MTTRILVVDDRPSFAEMLAVNLRIYGYSPIIAIDAASARAEVKALAPDAILLSALLDSESSPQSAECMTDVLSTELPIVLMCPDADCTRFVNLRNSASACLVKPFSSIEMVGALQGVLGDALAAADEQKLLLGPLALDAATRKVTFSGREVPVRFMEFKLLRYLLQYPEQVHSRDRLLQSVWGQVAHVNERTVDANIRRIRAGLGDGGSMIETVRSIGYRITATPRNELSNTVH